MTLVRETLCVGFIVSLMAIQPVVAQEDIEDIADATIPSLVVVTGYDIRGAATGQGVGFIVGNDSIVTIGLSVIGNADVVEIRSSDGELRYASEVIRENKDWNVALLRPERPIKPPGLTLAPTGSVEVGSDVVAVGVPGTGAQSISVGIVIALHPHAGGDDLMQITNVIGTSKLGGPLLDMQGQVVGVAKKSTQGQRSASFGVPSRVLADLLATASKDPERTLSSFADEVVRGKAMLRNFRAGLENQCDSGDLSQMDNILVTAINSGIGIYNSGDHQGCYLIYEGAGFKTLYMLENRCKPASAFLSRALVEAEETVSPGNYNSITGNKAWIMRVAFDALLGMHDENSGFGPENMD